MTGEPKGQMNITIPPPKFEYELTEYHVPIHLLHTQAYCERQIYLERIEGIQVPPTEEMVRGAERHDSLEIAHLEKAEIEIPVKEAIEKSAEERILLVSREVPVLGSATYGRIDEILIAPDRVLVIDDKPNEVAYYTNKLQVWGYCHTFQEMYRLEKPIYAVLRNRDSQKIVWEDIFTDDESSRVTDSINRIQAILSGKSTGEATKYDNRCRPCRFNRSCQK